MAPVLVQYHLHRSIPGTPCISFAYPHVGGSFVQVNQVFLISDPLRQVNCECLDPLKWAYLGRLLVAVTHSTIPDAVTMIEGSQRLGIDLKARLLMQEFGPFEHGVPRPRLQRHLAE